MNGEHLGVLNDVNGEMLNPHKDVNGEPHHIFFIFKNILLFSGVCSVVVQQDIRRKVDIKWFGSFPIQNTIFEILNFF